MSAAEKQPLPQKSSLSQDFNDKSLPAEARSALALSRVVAQGGQFTVIGDTGHSNMDLMEFMADDRTMAALARAGVKKLFMEIRPEFQGIADAVAAGKMTPEEYAEQRLEIIRENGLPYFQGKERDRKEGEVIAAAAKRGIKVYCAERQEAGIPAHARMSERLGMAEARLHGLLVDSAESREGLLQGMGQRGSIFLNLVSGGRWSQDAYQDAMKHLMEPYALQNDLAVRAATAERNALMEERLRADRDVAAYVRKEAGKDKSAVFYGAGHGRYACDLDDHLKAQRIELFTNASDMRAAAQETHMSGGKLPQWGLELSGGRLVSGAEMKEMLKQAPVLPSKFRPDMCK